MKKDKVIDDFGQEHIVIRDSKGRIYVDFRVHNYDFDRQTVVEHRDALYNLINDKNER